MKTAKQILEAMPLYSKLQKYKEINMSQRPKVEQILNATIVTGKYKDSNGEQKSSYLIVGTLFIYNGGGMSLKLDALPANGQDIQFYPRKQKNQQPQQQQQNNNNIGY